MKYYKAFYRGLNRQNTDCLKWDTMPNPYILPFWVADSDYPTFPDVKKALLKRCKHPAFGYTFIDDDYRRIVCEWIYRRYDYHINGDEITITPGVISALYLLVSLFTKPNDTVVVSSPVYNPFYRVITTSGRVLAQNKLREVKDEAGFSYAIDFADLEKKLMGAKMYILCNPHNPVGRVWKKEEIVKIVELCRKYNCFLVSDEIHCDLIMPGYEFHSVGRYLDKYENIAVCTAPSKTFNIAGLRHSNIIIRNKPARDKLNAALYNSSIGSPNIMGTVACKAAYLKGDRWVDTQNIYLHENYEILKNNILSLHPDIRLAKLEGTYLAWLDFGFLKVPQIELEDALLHENVKINSGTLYAQDKVGYIRFNLACGRGQFLAGLCGIRNAVMKLLKKKEGEAR